ncbi:ABC transporter ATP-binding protein [Halomarina oriensis]|uniref:ATP-binding cassette domain-containing protein n=1 Tax=Halomarina oriensis TaxID=671145 RepID=A0A6B0GRI2_9EURY|nr:ABC transporter ATP-binding protein [Halomarina oriensis]MWG35977.1 ATP-binding cassette domain-containing protein [Halomarina oriensis]
MSSERQGSADTGATPQRESYGPDDGILVVDDLRKEFGGLVAVEDFSFAVEEQEILGFIGPNGAGKSTTFNCVTGFYEPTAGTVWYQGEDVTGRPSHEMVNAGLARTFQHFRPLHDRSVVDNVALALVPDKLFSFGGLRGGTRDRAARLCERVGLGDDLHRTPDELPHAGLLRLELARALATDPTLLLVDEPFAGLAGSEVESISNLLRELREEGLTLVVVDHNMRGLLSLIDRAVVINFGSKLAEGTPEEIRNDEEVQRAYLGGDL